MGVSYRTAWWMWDPHSQDRKTQKIFSSESFSIVGAPKESSPGFASDENLPRGSLQMPIVCRWNGAKIKELSHRMPPGFQTHLHDLSLQTQVLKSEMTPEAI